MIVQINKQTDRQTDRNCNFIYIYRKEPGQLIVRCGEWDTQTNSEPLPHQDRKVKVKNK